MLIFGYKNFDIDIICFVIVYVDLKNKLGVEVELVWLGDINGEM